MTKFDKVISAVILGAVAPISLFLFFWWGSLPLLKSDIWIIISSLCGLLIGLILDFTALRGFISSLFTLPLLALSAVLIFYSIVIFGFFMGLPVFNILVGIAGSYIVAKKSVLQKADKHKAEKNVKLINIISATILFLICTAAATLALGEETICQQVKGMLNLSFKVTMGMIWGIILIGGATLLSLQFFISRYVASRILKAS